MQLKTILTCFIASITLNAKTQTPLDFGGGLHLELLDPTYKEGFDEALFVPMVMALKGNIKNCSIEQMAPGTQPRKGESALVYRYTYGFKSAGTFNSMHIDLIEKTYDKKDTIKAHIVEEGFIMENEKPKLVSYHDVDLKQTKLVVYEYNSHNKALAQRWYTMKNNAVDLTLPLKVDYTYSKKGMCTATGVLDKSYTGKGNLVKFTLEYDKDNRLIKRTIYNRDLRSTAENTPANMEVYTYSYSGDDCIVSMTYTKGTEKTKHYFFTCTNPDQKGNMQKQEVRDENKKLVYEINWAYEYN